MRYHQRPEIRWSFDFCRSGQAVALRRGNGFSAFALSPSLAPKFDERLSRSARINEKSTVSKRLPRSALREMRKCLEKGGFQSVPKPPKHVARAGRLCYIRADFDATGPPGAGTTPPDTGRHPCVAGASYRKGGRVRTSFDLQRHRGTLCHGDLRHRQREQLRRKARERYRRPRSSAG